VKEESEEHAYRKKEQKSEEYEKIPTNLEETFIARRIS
jgi:hypothetical protein